MKYTRAMARVCSFLVKIFLPSDVSVSAVTAFDLKAVIARPGLEGWNAISYTMTLEQMLESIGEPVKNWRKKNKN